MPTIKTVPKDIESLRGLLRARTWEKAAYIWAFCYNEGRGKFPRDRKTEVYSLAGFAALGIAGCRSENTVALYWNAWNDALIAGYVQPTTPGAEFEVPDLSWPYPPVGDDHFNAMEDDEKAEFIRIAAEEGTTPSQIARVSASVPALKAAIKANPVIAKAASEALIEETNRRHKELVDQHRAKQREQGIITDPHHDSESVKPEPRNTILGLAMLLKFDTDAKAIQKEFTGFDFADEASRETVAKMLDQVANTILATKSLVLNGSVSDQAEDFLKSLG